MSEHHLELGSVVVRYGKATAVDGVDVSAPGGTVTAVVGPNGAGKSSLLLAAYGSVTARGRIVLDGRDVGGLSALERSRAGLALVPQGRQLFPRMTVLENLRLAADLLKLPRGAVDGAFDRFPILRERGARYAGVLSGGEQQMLVVSRALLATPRVLLLDEMTTGLAPKIVRMLTDTVAGLARDGVAVLMAEPSLGPALRVVDRGYVVVRGKVVAECSDAASLDRAYQDAMGLITEEVESEVGTA